MTFGFASDKQRLGWFGTAWLLSLLLASSAGALDFSAETARHEGDSAAVLGTLGHARGFAPATSRKSNKDGLHFALKHATHKHPVHLKPKASARHARVKVAARGFVKRHRHH